MTKHYTFFQSCRLWLIFGIAFSGCLYGYNIGVMSGELLLVRKALGLGHEKASFFVASFLWGISLIMLLAGYLAERYGRKKILIAGASLALLSALILTFSETFMEILTGRFLMGVATGMLSVTTPTYLSETVPAHLRGRATLSFQVCLSFGIFIATSLCWCLAGQVYWTHLFTIELIPILVVLGCAAVAPESPRWQLNHHRKAQAAKTLQQFHSSEEAADILKQSPAKKGFTISMLWKPAYRWPLLLAIAIGGLNQATGINTILQYDTNILMMLGLKTHQIALLSSMLITLVNFLITCIAWILVDKIDRRALLKIGLAGTLISLLLIAILGYIPLSTVLAGWLLNASLLLFIVFFAIGPGALVWTFMSELLPTPTRSVGVAIALCFSSLSGALLASIFLPLSAIIGHGGIFFICAAATALYLFVSFKIPTTRGETLENIANQLGRQLEFTWHEESTLSWQEHHDIHQALNRAYSHRTDSFTKKSYGYITPCRRLLCKQNGKLIGRTAVFTSNLVLAGKTIPIAGIGLTLSLKPFDNIGLQLRKMAAEACGEMGYDLAIGRVKNAKRVREHLAPLVYDFVDIPLLGTASHSHDWETLALYKTGHDPKQAQALISQIKKQSELYLDTEVF